MKTAFIMDPATRNMVINEKAVNYFRSLGEVAFNESSPDKENVKQVIKGAQIAVTSWGNTAIDGENFEIAEFAVARLCGSSLTRRAA